MATVVFVSLFTVCTSTTVSTATSSSKASVQAPNLVGSPIAAGTGPAACVLNGSTSIYVFVKGYDGALWYRIRDEMTNYWTGGWVSLGGQLTSSPCAVSREAGYLSVYVRGTNGAVYLKQYVAGGWYNWYNVGGQVALGTGPGATGWPGREDVFAEGTNGALYQKAWTGSYWSGWESLGGKLTSSPAAVSQYSSVIDVFVRGTNGAVWQRYYYNGWSSWKSLGGQVASGTGPACSWNASREDVFVQGTNGALYQNTRTGTWSGWTSLGGKLTSSPTAATYTYSGTIDIEVFVRGAGTGNGLIYLKAYYNGVWWGWQGPYQGPP